MFVAIKHLTITFEKSFAASEVVWDILAEARSATCGMCHDNAMVVGRVKYLGAGSGMARVWKREGGRVPVVENTLCEPIFGR